MSSTIQEDEYIITLESWPSEEARLHGCRGFRSESFHCLLQQGCQENCSSSSLVSLPFGKSIHTPKLPNRPPFTLSSHDLTSRSSIIPCLGPPLRVFLTSFLSIIYFNRPFITSKHIANPSLLASSSLSLQKVSFFDGGNYFFIC